MSETAQPPQTQPARRRFPAVAWLCALSSLATLVLYLSFALHIRVHLGRWPVPMTENPAWPLLSVHEAVLVFGGLFAFYAAGPLWIACQFFPALRPSSRGRMIAQAALFAGGWLCIVLVFKYDPTRFSEWFLD